MYIPLHVHFLSSAYEISTLSELLRGLYNTIEKKIVGLAHLLFKELLSELSMQGQVILWFGPLQG